MKMLLGYFGPLQQTICDSTERGVVNGEETYSADWEKAIGKLISQENEIIEVFA